MSESDYPYTGVVGTCSYNASKAVGEIKSHTYTDDGNENDHKEKVETMGVVSVCINTNNIQFMS